MKQLAAWQTHFYCCGGAACLVAIEVCHGAPWCSKCQFTLSPRQSRRQILCLEYHSSTLQSLGSASSYTSQRLSKKPHKKQWHCWCHCRPVKIFWFHLTCSVNLCFIFLPCFARKLILLLFFSLESMLSEEHENNPVTIHSNQHCCTIHFIPPRLRVYMSCWI